MVAMASGREAVRLSEQEVADFLEDNLKVQLATVGPHGEPHLTTLFYVVDDGLIAFWTYGRSQKIVNLRRDPRVSALVEDGAAYDELRGVSITGTARLVEDYDEVKRVGTLVVTRMAGGVDLGDFGAEAVAAQARKRVVVVIEPDHVASWDHRKMNTGEG